MVKTLSLSYCQWENTDVYKQRGDMSGYGFRK